MADELSRIAERARQNRTARRQSSDDAERHAATRTAGARSTLFAGDRVFDLGTGLYGDVQKVGLADGLLRGDAQIALEDGRVVIRDAGTLIRQPAAPRS